MRAAFLDPLQVALAFADTPAVSALSRRFRCHPDRIRGVLQAEGIAPMAAGDAWRHAVARRQEHAAPRIAACFLELGTIRQVAETLGRSHKAVSKALRSQGVVPKAGRPRVRPLGEDHWQDIALSPVAIDAQYWRCDVCCAKAMIGAPCANGHARVA